MIRLYRESNSPEADAIEAELKDILLAYEVMALDPAAARERFGSSHRLPVLANNERIVSGKQPLDSYLKELRKFMHAWQAFQGDSCYVDEDGEPCKFSRGPRCQPIRAGQFGHNHPAAS